MSLDFSPNFSCSDPRLSRDNVTEEAWTINSSGKYHDNSVIAVAALQVLYLLIGIPWNTVVVLVILKKKYYKEPTYVILLNMVIADLFVCVICLPFGIATALLQEFNIGSSDYVRCTVCQFIDILILIFTNYSLFALAFLSVDRLIYIRWPLKYDGIMTLSNIAIFLVASIIVCIITALPPAFGFGEIKFANALGVCTLYAVGTNRVTRNVYYLWVQIAILSVPVSLALIANIWQVIIACKTSHNKFSKKRECNMANINKTAIDRRVSNQELKIEYTKQQVRLAQVFSAIFFLNIITWIPSQVILIISTLGKEEILSAPSLAVVYLIFLSQPVLHPILETCLVGKARWMFIKIVAFFCKNKAPPAKYSSATRTNCQTPLELL